MTDRDTLLSAGKRIAATATGRAFKDGSPKVKAEDLLDDPTLDRQGDALASKRAEKESQSEPGNPNDLGHEDQQPGQEKAGSS